MSVTVGQKPNSSDSNPCVSFVKTTSPVASLLVLYVPILVLTLPCIPITALSAIFAVATPAACLILLCVAHSALINASLTALSADATVTSACLPYPYSCCCYYSIFQQIYSQAYLFMNFLPLHIVKTLLLLPFPLLLLLLLLLLFPFPLLFLLLC